MPIELLADIAYGALALLIGVLAIYFALRVLGRIAKFVVTVVVLIGLAIALFMVFSNTGAARAVFEAAASLQGFLVA